MSTYIIKGDRQHPEIDFNAITGILNISGRSIPEDTFSFYQPLVDWVESYAKSPAKETRVKVYLEYFNTSSSKFILEIFKKLRPITDFVTKSVVVEWYYDEDDEEMMETGEDYQDVSGLPFEIIEMED